MKFVQRFILIGHGLQRRDILAALLALLISAGLLVAATGWMTSNVGFGPGWTCTNPGSGGPVCIKQPAPSAK
jgi:hypothetical protein